MKDLTIGQSLRRRLALVLALAAVGCAGGSDPGGTGGKGGDTIAPGSTDFVTDELGSSGRNRGAPTAEAGDADDGAGGASAPGGRMGEVQEADIYRMVGDRLYYLNTYRGFVVYDVKNPKAPVRVARLPVFGYPVEMFVDGNTVYALLRDALYLTEEKGTLRFQRHNVSQMVAIDVSDIANPRVLQTVDITGELREGVSRKIDDTIYVVSYVSQSYWYGWRNPGDNQRRKEQAWVYSFNVADAKNMRLVQELKVFEGGSIDFHDPQLGIGLSRHFNSVSISATANALMVVENWYISSYQNQASSDGKTYRCGSYSSDQQAIVSIIDISDPTGVIRKHTNFQTAGHVGDQFKMTYAFDEASKTGTFFGVFARRGWSGSDCSGQSFIENVLESWDVTNGAAPARLASMRFGKPNETVRGSAYDMDRKLLYAITAEQIDPLYTIDLSNRAAPQILSAIDGLSGDMNVFRLISGGNFLLGIGQDRSETCQGFQDGTGRQPTKVAVSIIDVRQPAAARLVQRACVAIENAEWIGSDVNWNLDQAHKMIGMHSDDDVNVITVPVYYWKRAEDDRWWWYNHETAVGLMTWDLSRYDDTKPPSQQTVLQNFGTVVHPNGQVRRSIVFTHQGSARRMMMNLSDTHVSVVDLQDLGKPSVQSVIELAPYYGQLFGFGGYVVEHLQQSPHYGWGPQQGASEFRIKPVGGNVEETAAVASFRIGQVTRVIKHGENLLLFRTLPADKDPRGDYVPPQSEVVVMDLTDPTRPRLAGSTPLPQNIQPYYGYYCGGDGYWGGFWFDGQNNWTSVSAGLVFLGAEWDERSNKASTRLTFLDLRTKDKPVVSQTPIAGDLYDNVFGIVADPVSPTGFFLNYRDSLGTVKRGTESFSQVRYYAQRWELGDQGFVPGASVNLPGRLVRTWAGPRGERLYLAQDQVHREVAQPDGQGTYWQSDYRLNLLLGMTRDGREVASLRDSHHFVDRHLSDLVPDGDRLYVNASRGGGYYWGWAEGDVAVAPGVAFATASEPDYTNHLVIFDLSALTLNKVYDQSTNTYNMRLMGLNQGHLFVNLPGDGVLAVDVSNPAKPAGRQFLRTLGYASHIEFAGSTAYVAAGYFGIYQMTLVGPRPLALD